MCRTIVNVTGDAAVSMIVAKSVGKLKDPKDVNKVKILSAPKFRIQKNYFKELISFVK